VKAMTNVERVLKNKISRLTRIGYRIEHTKHVGFWVDGCCGYQVAGYFDSLEEAVDQALAAIQKAQKEVQEGVSLGQPVWLFSQKIRKFN